MGGINVDLIKERMKKYQDASAASGNHDGKKLFWKPEFGENIIRIVPYKFAPDMPFMKVWTYWNFGGHKMLVSPMSVGQPDPIVEYIRETKKNTVDKDHREIIDKIYPKGRWYSPIVVRGKEEEGVKFWQYSKTVWEQIEGMIVNPYFGDIADEKEGMDLILTYSKPEGKGKYPTSKVMAVPQKTPLADTDEMIQKLLGEQVDLNTLLKPKSYDELQGILKAYLEEVDKAKPSKPSKPSNNSGKKAADVGDDFDDLFKNDAV